MDNLNKITHPQEQSLQGGEQDERERERERDPLINGNNVGRQIDRYIDPVDR